MDSNLYHAAISGNYKFIENLKNTDPSNFFQETRGHRNSILHISVKFGELQMAEKIIVIHPSLLHQQNSRGDSPLHVAARLGRPEMVQLLINHAKLVEVEVEKELLRMENKEKDTALHVSVRNGHFEVVSILLSEDPELSKVVNSSGESPLFLALDRQFYSIACLVLEAAPMCSFGGRNRMNVLHAAILRVDKRFAFMVGDVFRNIIAVSSKKVNSCLNQFLPELYKLQCLQFEHSYKMRFIGTDFITEVIKRCPATMSEADDLSWIPLHYAAHSGNVQVVELFLQIDVSLAYAKDNLGMSALHISAKSGHNHVIKILLMKCPDSSELLDNRGRTALHIAAENGKTNTVKILTFNRFFGDDLINQPDNDGNTAFHLAGLQGHQKILALLANDSRVDKGGLNNEGLTVFDIVKSNMLLKQHQEAPFMWKLKTWGVECSLQNATNTRNLLEDTTPSIQDQQQQEHEMRKVNLSIAAIIAAITFLAAFSIPVQYQNINVQDGGHLVPTQKSSFRVFLLADSFAFGLSSASMFLILVASRMKNDRIAPSLMKYSCTFCELSIYGMVVAFLAGISAVLATCSGLLATVVVATGCSFFLGPLAYTLVTYMSFAHTEFVEKIY